MGSTMPVPDTLEKLDMYIDSAIDRRPDHAESDELRHRQVAEAWIPDRKRAAPSTARQSPVNSDCGGGGSNPVDPVIDPHPARRRHRDERVSRIEPSDGHPPPRLPFAPGISTTTIAPARGMTWAVVSITGTSVRRNSRSGSSSVRTRSGTGARGRCPAGRTAAHAPAAGKPYASPVTPSGSTGAQFNDPREFLPC